MKYVLTSDKFEGSITYDFNDQGYMHLFSVNSTDLKENQWNHVLTGLGECLMETHFKAWSSRYSFKIDVIHDDLSFERFWNVYNIKRNKIETQKLWEKYSNEERQLIFVNHEAYERYCIRNSKWYNKMYPDTYLRSHYKDEWDKLK